MLNEVNKKSNLYEINKVVVDLSSFWQKETATGTQLMEEEQFMILKVKSRRTVKILQYIKSLNNKL